MFSKYLSQKYQLSFICPALFFLSFGLSSDVLSEDTGVLPGPSAHAGPDQVSLVGEPVFFYGSGSTHDYEIIQYEWDFDGDGDIDCFSDKPDTTAFTFSSPGRYRCTLTVSDSAGESVTDECFITVARNSTELPAISAQHQPLFEDSGLPADGIVHQYSIIINGGSEARYWTDVELTYRMLTEGYGFTDSDIFLLNYRGLNPTDENPEGMIDGPAYIENVEQTFQEIAAIADADDELYLWLHDHGRGYSGLLSQGGIYYGYCDGRISVDPNDEPDFNESDFKLRSIFTGGDYRCNHGLNEWVVRKKYYTSLRTNYYRNKYVSQFNNVYIENLGRKIRDRDIFIERFVDYLMGDTNKDGYIETDIGEVLDFDGDGNLPYDHATGTFDEDDWGPIDVLENDHNFTNGGLPEGAWPIKLFDHNFDGKLCIDLGYAGGDPEIDGCDEDGQGLFDWMDVNQDGDADDIVSVDEGICLAMGMFYDDDLSDQLERLNVGKVILVALPCFSGGFVEDISGPDRILCTATIEEAVSWGDLFIRGFVAALHGQDQYSNAVDADTDQNGRISMLEAFNYAAANDYYDEIPQYDDNADGVSHTDPVPNGGDGLLGSDTYLRSPANPDFNNNGIVDLIDLSTFSRFWGLNNGGIYRNADLTGDSNVNLADLEIIALNWLVGQSR